MGADKIIELREWKQILNGPETDTFPARVWPSFAEETLRSHNPRNRPISKRQVAALSAAITDGRFERNGETLIFSATGDLMDGQNRLAAVVASSLPIETFVVRGVRPEAFASIDQCRPRNDADRIAMMGIDPRLRFILSPMIRNIWRYRNRKMLAKQCLPGWEVLKQILSEPAVIESAEFASHRWSLQRHLEPQLIAWFHYLRTNVSKHADRSTEWEEKFESGADMKIGDGVLAVRERLLRRTEARAKDPPHYAAAWLIIGWNSWVTGRRLTKIQFEPFGKRPQDFPEIL